MAKKTVALLVGVVHYPINGYPPLPLCAHDIEAIRDAMVSGLNVSNSDIVISGTNGVVTAKDLITDLTEIAKTAAKDDCFIFYFTGHGMRNGIALSDTNIALNSLITVIDSIPAKSKVIMLDCCQAGDFSVGESPVLDFSNTVDAFAGKGYAVLASCGCNEFSGFNEKRRLSLYTSFLVDAITCRALIREGKKSLEMISEAVYQYAKAWERNEGKLTQNPIFRSNIGGTIYFNVEDYAPYKAKTIYEETDRYIIYSVQPLHTGLAKRLSAKIILRYECSLTEIASIADEVRLKILHAEVYKNAIAEQRYAGKPANIIWCYFAYSEDDISDGNFFCHTTWVDDKQDKNWWYKLTATSQIINGIHININQSYNMIKNMLHAEEVDVNALVEKTRKLTERIVSAGEKYISHYREYRNNVISEDELVENVAELNEIISGLFLLQSDLPYAPKELREWSNRHTAIAASIHDFSLFYNKQYMGKWKAENRIYLMDAAIKRYESDLEALRTAEKQINSKQ